MTSELVREVMFFWRMQDVRCPVEKSWMEVEGWGVRTVLDRGSRWRSPVTTVARAGPCGRVRQHPSRRLRSCCRLH
jgi:hypothetical protein